MKNDYAMVLKASVFSDLMVLISDYIRQGVPSEEKPLLERARKDLMMGILSNDEYNFMENNMDDILGRVKSFASKKVVSGLDVNDFDLDLLKAAIDGLADCVLASTKPEDLYMYDFIQKWYVNIKNKVSKAQEGNEQQNYQHESLTYRQSTEI